MKRVIDYLKDTHSAYARMVSQDRQALAHIAERQFRDIPRGHEELKARLKYREDFLEELNDVIETLENGETP